MLRIRTNKPKNFNQDWCHHWDYRWGGSLRAEEIESHMTVKSQINNPSKSNFDRDITGTEAKVITDNLMYDSYRYALDGINDDTWRKAWSLQIKKPWTEEEKKSYLLASAAVLDEALYSKNNNSPFNEFGRSIKLALVDALWSRIDTVRNSYRAELAAKGRAISDDKKATAFNVGFLDASFDAINSLVFVKMRDEIKRFKLSS